MTEPRLRPGGLRWLRRALPVGLVTALTIGLSAAPALADGTPPAPVQTTLLPPTGRQQVGTVSLHYVDPTRTDPLLPGRPVREFMGQIWYPATDADRFPLAPYLPLFPIAPGSQVLPPATVAHEGAPVDRGHGPRPVVLYSPGAGTGRAIGTGLVEDLASHGYIVIALDPTDDAPTVSFPGGRQVQGIPIPPTTDAEAFNAYVTTILANREGDARFVLNTLPLLDGGGHPDPERTPLPRGLAGSMDLSRIGMFGWSLGGDTAAELMATDPRIRVGIDLDGTIFGPAARTGVTRPFLVMGHVDRGSEPTWVSFFAHTTGPRLALKLANSQHLTFSDDEQLLPEVASVQGYPPDQVAALIGTIDPDTAVTDQRAYVGAFFDQYLLGRHSRLLDGPSPRFPDVIFQP